VAGGAGGEPSAAALPAAAAAAAAAADDAGAELLGEPGVAVDGLAGVSIVRRGASAVRESPCTILSQTTLSTRCPLFPEQSTDLCLLEPKRPVVLAQCQAPNVHAVRRGRVLVAHSGICMHATKSPSTTHPRAVPFSRRFPERLFSGLVFNLPSYLWTLCSSGERSLFFFFFFLLNSLFNTMPELAS
jgi:hypothetical protein